MSRSNGLLTGLTAALILATAPASAVVIAEYKFQSGDPAIEDNSSSDGDLTTSAEAVTYGNASFTNAVVTSGERAAALSVFNANDTLALAQSENDYISFKIVGSNFEIASITFDHALTQAGNGNIYSYHVLSDQDNFANVITNGGTDSIVGGVDGLTNTANVNGAELGTIASEITFRIYLTDNLGIDAGFQTIDNIVVNGVPEPASLAVLGILGVFLLSRRRRTA